MKISSKSFWIAILCTMVLAFACVTINIYFPAEKVKSVAGDIVKDIRGGEKKEAPKGDKSSFLGEIYAALSPARAWAGDVTTVSNPTIRALKKKLKNNYLQMKPYYKRGMVKEQNNGYVSVVTTRGLNLKQKRNLKSLISAENRYRKQLYAEVARALNIDPSQINKVAEIFAKEWQKSVR